MDEVQARIVKLHDRQQQLTAYSPASFAADEVRRAARFVEIAQQRAAEAAGRAVQARLAAARAHDRTADVLERAGSARSGADYATQARRHRRAAAADRAAARELAARLRTA